MTLGIAAVSLLTVVVIGAIIGATNGKPPSRIYRGQDAKVGEFKWMVSLSSGHHFHRCGGAIISSRHIITAAHCVSGLRPSRIVVRSGIVDLDDETAIESTVARFVIHPDYKIITEYSEKVPWNDIAIVELEEDLVLGERLSAIPLSTTKPERGRARFSGWGDLSTNPTIMPTKLQAADVKVFYWEQCWDKTGPAPARPQNLYAYQETGNNLPGDSGSPLVLNGTLIGVMSLYYGIPGSPDTYTMVYCYLDWINSVTRETINEAKLLCVHVSSLTYDWLLKIN